MKMPGRGAGRVQAARGETTPSEAAAELVVAWAGLEEKQLSQLRHDVRTPLAALLMWVRLLCSGLATDAPAARASIEQCAAELTAAIEALLERARLAPGDGAKLPTEVAVPARASDFSAKEPALRRAARRETVATEKPAPKSKRPRPRPRGGSVRG